jgi:hypothetical protein
MNIRALILLKQLQKLYKSNPFINSHIMSYNFDINLNSVIFLEAKNLITVTWYMDNGFMVKLTHSGITYFYDLYLRIFELVTKSFLLPFIVAFLAYLFFRS